MKKRFLFFLMLVLVVFIAVACSSSDDSKEATQTEESEDEGENNSELDEEQEKNKNNDKSDSDKETSNDQELPESIDINEQIQHPNGVVLTVEEIKFNDNHISVDFNAQNGSQQTVLLAANTMSQDGVKIEDDTGFHYAYVRDDDDQNINLEKLEEVTGTLSFMGKVQDEAKSLTLIFNPGNSQDDKLSNTPSFKFENIEIKR